MGSRVYTFQEKLGHFTARGLFNNDDCFCVMSNFEFHKQFDLETTVGLPHCRPLTDANHPNLKRFKMHFYKSQIEVSFNKAYISIIIQVDPAYLIKLPQLTSR